MGEQNQGQIKRWYLRWWMFPIYLVLVAVVVSSTNDAKEKAQSANAPTAQPDQVETASTGPIGPGDEGYLRVSNSEIVTVLKTEELQEQFMKSGLANDTYGMAKIIADGGGFNVPVGTKVLVIDSEVGVRKVRVLTGDHAMQEGWVAKEFVQKQ